jgi:hypothetical protein
MASALEVVQEAYIRKKMSRLDIALPSSQAELQQPNNQIFGPTVKVSFRKLFFIEEF